jgi:hypothetical protein
MRNFSARGRRVGGCRSIGAGTATGPSRYQVRVARASRCPQNRAGEAVQPRRGWPLPTGWWRSGGPAQARFATVREHPGRLETCRIGVNFSSARCYSTANLAQAGIWRDPCRRPEVCFLGHQYLSFSPAARARLHCPRLFLDLVVCRSPLAGAGVKRVLPNARAGREVAVESHAHLST